MANFFFTKREQDDIQKASLLVKARRLAVAANGTVAPSCLQGRVARGQPLPQVALMPLPDGQTDGEEEQGQRDEGRTLRTTLAFMCGLGREAMPRDVFWVVVDLLMSSSGPLRKRAGARPPKQG